MSILGESCQNCPYIQELRRELASHNADIKENRLMIMDLHKISERNDEKYNQLLTTITELKTTLITFIDKFNSDLTRVDRETLINTERLKFKIDVNWKTLTPVLIALLTLIQMLLTSFVK